MVCKNHLQDQFTKRRAKKGANQFLKFEIEATFSSHLDPTKSTN